MKNPLALTALLTTLAMSTVSAADIYQVGKQGSAEGEIFKTVKRFFGKVKGVALVTEGGTYVVCQSRGKYSNEEFKAFKKGDQYSCEGTVDEYEPVSPENAQDFYVILEDRNLAAEAEAKRIADEEKAKRRAERDAEKAEAKRIADIEKEKRKAERAEAKRIADEEKAKRKAEREAEEYEEYKRQLIAKNKRNAEAKAEALRKKPVLAYGSYIAFSVNDGASQRIDYGDVPCGVPMNQLKNNFKQQAGNVGRTFRKVSPDYVREIWHSTNGLQKLSMTCYEPVYK